MYWSNELWFLISPFYKIGFRNIKEQENDIKKNKSVHKSSIIYHNEVEHYDEEQNSEDYPVNSFLTAEVYFKKITPQSLRMSGDHKLKEGDVIVRTMECTNRDEIIFFTNMQRAYKVRLHEFDDTKTSVLGDYLPSKLSMDDGEQVIFMMLPSDYKGYLFIAFDNGKRSEERRVGKECRV